MGTKLRREKEIDRIFIYCPGCKTCHAINSSWTISGNDEIPTIRPSVLVTSHVESHPARCHFFVDAGQIRYLPDCSHDLAGKTVPMVDVDLTATLFRLLD